MQNDTRLSLLQAQLEEIEAVEACYPGGELSFTHAEASALGVAAAAVAGSAAVEPEDVPALSGTLRLPGVQLAGQPVLLKFTLPRGSSGQPGLQVLSNASRQAADELQAVASSTAAECAPDGAPCLLLVADRLAQAAQQLAEVDAAQRQQAAQQPASDAGRGGGGRSEARRLVLSRRCVWFHHIKNLTKRKSIVAWGGELGLGGYSKPGFPGVVLVEGAGSDVDEYLQRLRRLRWQAMAVRGEEDEAMTSQQELEAARRLPRGVQELGEEDMGRLAAASRAAGLEPLFLTALKLGGGGGGGGGTRCLDVG